ncbi:DNA adenine methylase [Methyloversatilis sp.]|uniref:DNA adenine methylase n=1 Tax=Methyloversatilis sp. TaxID=2569862 RepID=UPI002736E6D1|nr:DNA adenine methylase [Methyloversatilis sp.]MDP3579158.1 DNA adenine methylase [Methyloversatilis sp.]
MAKPIIPWIGGKRRLAKQILPLFPEHTCYVEPFCGGAALFFMKVPSKVEVLNDLNGDVINLYRVVTHHLDEFVRQFRWALSSRESFLHHQLADVRTLTDIQRAARFFYLQKMCFGAKVEGQRFGTGITGPKRINLTRLEEDLSAAHLRLGQAVIEHLDWQACAARYDRQGTLFFIDPPYWQTEGYGVPFGFEQYEALASLARSAKGSVIITVNDHPDMRRVFAGLDIRTASINYTVGGSGRSSSATELIITALR